MAWYVGVDVGSVATKGVITNDGEVVSCHLVSSGFHYGEAAKRLQLELLEKAGVTQGDVKVTATTGAGAGNVPFQTRSISEILCCVRGIQAIFPTVTTVIIVGGQSSQAVRIGEYGRMADFVVSEKCAAGSARFLQVIANVLRISLADIGPLSLKSTSPITFSTGCAVFGETEAITRVAEGFAVEDILAGVHQSLANKLYSLAIKVGLDGECAICGGGALDVGLIKSLEGKLGSKLLVPDHPQHVAALGAALLVQEKE